MLLRLLLLGFYFSSLSLVFLSAQSWNLDYVGIYKYNTKSQFAETELQLRADGTFRLKAYGEVGDFNTLYENEGQWVSKGGKVVLNPEKAPRPLRFSLVEKEILSIPSDSIRIKIDHQLEEYEEEQLVRTTSFPFTFLTFYINKNKTKRRYTLVQDRTMAACSFGPRWGTQIKMDSTYIFTIPKRQVKKIGLFAYGFDKAIEFVPLNPESNYFEIKVNQAIDKEQMPRSREVVMKKGKAYYFKWKGAVSTAWFRRAMRKVE